MIFKSILLFSLFVSFVESAAMDKPSWVFGGEETLEKALQVKRRFQAHPEARYIHSPDLVEEMTVDFESILTQATDPGQQVRLGNLQRVFGLFVEAESVTWDVASLFSLGVAYALDTEEISPAVLQFDEVKELIGALELMGAASDPAAAKAIAASVTQRVQEQSVAMLPYFTFSKGSGALGVKTLLDAFVLHDIIPVVIPAQSASVHGGLVKGIFSFVLHDYAHGLLYAKAMHGTDLAKHLPRIQQEIQSLSGRDRASQIKIVQNHILFHETTVLLENADRARLKTPQALATRAIHEMGLATGTEDDLKIARLSHSLASILNFIPEHLDVLRSMGVDGKSIRAEPLSAEKVRITFSEEEMPAKEVHVTWTHPTAEILKYSFELVLVETAEGGSYRTTAGDKIGSIETLFQNVSDYAWLGKKLGFISGERHLKRNPLTSVELRKMFMEIMSEPNSLFSLPEEKQDERAIAAKPKPAVAKKPVSRPAVAKKPVSRPAIAAKPKPAGRAPKKLAAVDLVSAADASSREASAPLTIRERIALLKESTS